MISEQLDENVCLPIVMIINLTRFIVNLYNILQWYSRFNYKKLIN